MVILSQLNHESEFNPNLHYSLTFESQDGQLAKSQISEEFHQYSPVLYRLMFHIYHNESKNIFRITNERKERTISSTEVSPAQ